MVLKPFQQQRGTMVREGKDKGQDGGDYAIRDDVVGVDVVHDGKCEGERRHEERGGDKFYEVFRDFLFITNECVGRYCVGRVPISSAIRVGGVDDHGEQ